MANRMKYLACAAAALLIVGISGCMSGKTSPSQTSSTAQVPAPAPAPIVAAPAPAVPTAAPSIPSVAATPAAETIDVAALAAANAGANLASSKVTSPPVGQTAGQSRRTGGDPVDDRVELRTYHFTNTDEDLPYAVFVSSKVSKDKKAPLVLALHGFGGNHGTFMRTACVDEAEANGYILVGVMGYSPSAPFGGTMRGLGPGRRGGPPPNAPGMAPGTNSPARGAMFPARGGRGGPPVGGTKETDPAKVSMLSETDTMNVLYMALKEFNVDANRIYLMGHSMGGYGTWSVAMDHPDVFAALGPISGGGNPAGMVKLARIPEYVVHGDADPTVPVIQSRTMVEAGKKAGAKIVYVEVPGGNHMSVVAPQFGPMLEFLVRQKKNAD